MFHRKKKVVLPLTPMDVLANVGVEEGGEQIFASHVPQATMAQLVVMDRNHLSIQEQASDEIDDALDEIVMNPDERSILDDALYEILQTFDEAFCNTIADQDELLTEIEETAPND